MIGSYFSLLISIGLPLAAFLYCVLKRRQYVLPFALGMLTFTVFQVLTRLPMIQAILPGFAWYRQMTQNIWLYMLFLSLTAALFEEGGRYIVMHFLFKRGARYEDAVAFGMGHGGIEAVLLVGVPVLYALLVTNQGAEVSVYAGVERLSTFSIHICWSVLVMRALRENKLRYLALAMLFHFSVNFFTIALQFGASFLFVEGILFAAAVGFAFYTLRLKRYFTENPPDADNADALPENGTDAADDTQDNE
jgi:uncharacterized membrane protein YhfC